MRDSPKANELESPGFAGHHIFSLKRGRQMLYEEGISRDCILGHKDNNVRI